MNDKTLEYSSMILVLYIIVYIGNPACTPTKSVAEILKYAKNVIPSKEGIQTKLYLSGCFLWIPACAGMTNFGRINMFILHCHLLQQPLSAGAGENTWGI